MADAVQVWFQKWEVLLLEIFNYFALRKIKNSREETLNLKIDKASLF